MSTHPRKIKIADPVTRRKQMLFRTHTPILHLSCLFLSVAMLCAQGPVTMAETPQSIPTPTNPAPTSNNTLSTQEGTSLQLQTGSQTVPQGTLLTLQFRTQMDSRITQTGEPFSAVLAEDFYAPPSEQSDGHPRLILPKNSMIRGRVQNVKRAQFFSQGGAITLAFDHIVLPTGDLLPVLLNLSPKNEMIKQFKKENVTALYADPGISVKLNKGVKDGVKLFQSITDKGIKAGESWGNGAGMIAMAPVAVVGGALAGTAVSTQKAAIGIFGRGEPIMIKPGDRITVDFGGSFALPSD
ncbi:MAG: hypothetical protein K2X01_05820 [Cyanobacteria bacterium]|nr:hypothetical protein [Cyanobacteriota bacterium]